MKTRQYHQSSICLDWIWS